MRFSLPENVPTMSLEEKSTTEPYFGLPKDLVDNDAIPLPPGLSRVRTLRKMHLELDVVQDRLKKWDGVQVKLEDALLALRKTADDLGDQTISTSDHRMLEREYCYLQNQVNRLHSVAGDLDPRTSEKQADPESFITLPSTGLHYLAVYDDNPWVH